MATMSEWDVVAESAPVDAAGWEPVKETRLPAIPSRAAVPPDDSLLSRVAGLWRSLTGGHSVMDNLPPAMVPDAEPNPAGYRVLAQNDLARTVQGNIRRDFTQRNPRAGALAAGSAQTLQGLFDAVPMLADAFNAYVTDPVMQAVGGQPLPPASRLPGAAALQQAGQDYTPALNRRSLAGVWANDQTPEWLLAQGAQQAPQLVSSLAAAFMPAMRLPYLAAMGGQAGGMAHQQNLQQGYSKATAVQDALARGEIEVLTEALPFGVFDAIGRGINRLPTPATHGAAMAQRWGAGAAGLAGQAATNGLEEMTAQLGGNALDNVVLNKDTPLLSRVPEAGAIGAATGAPMGASHLYQAATRLTPEEAIARTIQHEVDQGQWAAPASEVAAQLLSPENAQWEVAKSGRRVPAEWEVVNEQLTTAAAPEAQVAPADKANAPAESANGEMPSPNGPEPAPAAPDMTAWQPHQMGAIVRDAGDAAPALTAAIIDQRPDLLTAYEKAMNAAGWQYGVGGKWSRAGAPMAPKPFQEPPAAPATQPPTVAPATPPEAAIGAEAALPAEPEADPLDEDLEPDPNPVSEPMGPDLPGHFMRNKDGHWVEPAEAWQDTFDAGYTTLEQHTDKEQGDTYWVLTHPDPAKKPIEIPHAEQVEVVRKLLAERAAQPSEPAAPATHIENGVPEVATVKVVGMALKKSANKVFKDFRKAKDNLLGEVERAIDDARATKPAYDGVDFEQHKKDLAAWERSRPKWIVFDVEGDGQFKVRNTEKNLDAFRAKINASRGFNGPPKGPSGPGGPGYAPEASVKQMLEDGEYGAALELSKVSGKPLRFGATSEGNPPVAYVDAKEGSIGSLDVFVGRSWLGNKAGAWHVIELTTGLSMASGKTAEAAVAEAKRRLKENPELAARNMAAAKKVSHDELEQRWLEAVEKRDASDAKNTDDAPPAAMAQGEPLQDTGAPTVEVRRIKPRKDRSRVPPISSSVDDIESVTTSKYLDEAFATAGLDPETARMMTPGRQFDKLAETVKGAFGFKAVERDNNLTLREAIDQLAELMHNGQSLAAVWHLPMGALSLDGRLTLKLHRAAGGALAYFQPGSWIIGVVRRNSSYAHEWGHALDHLVNTLFPPDPATQGWGVSGQLRRGGTGTSHEALGAAFKDLIDAMFGAKVDAAGKIAAIEKKIERALFQRADAQAKLDATTNSDRQAHLRKEINRLNEFIKRLAKQIANIKAKPAGEFKTETDYYLNAQMLAAGVARDAHDGEAYWSRPTEMLARSFEAYSAMKLAAAGADFGFATKTDARYQNEADDFLAKAYPKHDDRDTIFAAWDALMMVAGQEGIFAQGQVPEIALDKPLSRRHFVPSAKPETLSVMNSIRMSLARAAADRKSEALRAARKRVNERKLLTPARQQAAGMADLALAMQDKITSASHAFILTMRGQLLSFAYKYPQASMLQLRDWFATDPGSGDLRKPVFVERVRQSTTQALNDLAAIIKEHKLDTLQVDEFDPRSILPGRPTMKTLRDMLLGVGTADPRLVPAVKALRQLLDAEHYYVTSHGVNIGYTKENYLPRQPDAELIAADPTGFLGKAGDVYRIVFSRDVGEWGDPGFKMHEFVKYARDLVRDGHPAYDQRRKLMKLLRTIAGLEKELEHSDEPDAVQEKLAKANDELDELMQEFYPVVQEEFAAAAANDWYAQLTGLAPKSPFLDGERQPATRFAKRRILPAEADTILEPYLVTDVLVLLTNYLAQTRRRVAFGEYFGEPDAKAGRALGWKLDAALTELKPRMISDDFNELAKMVEILAGRYQSNVTTKGHRFRNSLVATYAPVILGRSIYSQLAEPVAIGARSGRLLADTFGTFWNQLEDLLSKTGMASKSMAERVAWRYEMAQYLGATSHHLVDQMMSNRDNLMYMDRANQSRMSSFYYWSGIHPHAMSMRRAAVERGFVYLARMAAKAQKGDSQAARDLRDLGLAPTIELYDFIEQMGERPTPDDLDNPMGRSIAAAVYRFVDEAVQNPSAIDKPRHASTPELQLMYAVTAFNFTFQRNFIIRQAKRAQVAMQEDGKQGAAATAAMLGGFGLILALQGAAYLLRLGMFGRLDDELEEAREKGPSKLMLTMISRAGLYGAPGDIAMNALIGLKYERDLTAVPAGTYIGSIAQHTQNIVRLATRNSPNTNTAEYNATKSFWELVAAPMIARGMLNRAPFLAPALQYTSGPFASDTVAGLVAGEKHAKKAKLGLKYARLNDDDDD